jgi:hypothetical protein
MLSMDKDPAALHATDDAQIFQTGSANAFGARLSRSASKIARSRIVSTVLSRLKPS